MRFSIRILIRIAPRSVVSHSGLDSKEDSNKEFPRERCEALW